MMPENCGRMEAMHNQEARPTPQFLDWAITDEAALPPYFAAVS